MSCCLVVVMYSIVIDRMLFFVFLFACFVCVCILGCSLCMSWFGDVLLFYVIDLRCDCVFDVCYVWLLCITLSCVECCVVFVCVLLVCMRLYIVGCSLCVDLV